MNAAPHAREASIGAVACRVLCGKPRSAPVVAERGLRQTATQATAPVSGRAARWGRRLTEASFLLLLCCLAGRCFLQELQFRSSPLSAVFSPVAGLPEADASPSAGNEDLCRITFAVLLLAAGALAALGAAVGGRLAIRRAWMGGLVLLFAAAALVSGLLASDKYSGMLVWLEQASLLSACFLAVQLCAEERRWRLLLAVLLALGVAMAFKGLWQYFVETPERAEYYRAYAAGQPARTGPAGAGSEEARRLREMLEVRIGEPEPIGYIGLANPFASLLIVLLAAASGVAAEMAGRATAAFRAPGRRKGEVPAVAVGAFAAGAVSAALLLTLLLTHSRAGIASALAAIVAGIAIGIFRRRLARHWRKAVAVSLAAAVLIGAGTTAYGLRNDSLPGKSLTFRWFYWTASAEIVRDHPVWGVGGGNFPDAYLAHRRAEAEETVKDPHNFIMHALTQFGLMGGLPYLAMVLLTLACLARPRGLGVGPQLRVDGEIGCHGCAVQQPCGTSRRPSTAANSAAVAPGLAVAPVIVPIVAVSLAVLLSRLFFGRLGSDVRVLLFDAVWPAMVFAAALAMAIWVVGMLGEGTAFWPRMAVAVGSAAFVLHDLVEFGLWMPGVALVFWVSVGGCLARSGGGRERDLSRFRAPLAVAGALAAVLAAFLFWAPTFEKARLDQQAAECWNRRDLAGAIHNAERAAEVRPDSIADEDVARILVSSTPPEASRAGEGLVLARNWAARAALHGPDSSSAWRLLADTGWYLAVPDSFLYERRATDGNFDDRFRGLVALAARLPASAAIQTGLGDLEGERGRPAEAVAYYSSAAQRDPNSTVLRGRLGDALWQAGRKAEAYAAWQEAAARFPSDPKVQGPLGSMRAAVHCNPMDAHLRISFARMLCQAGESAACLMELSAVEDLDRRLVEFGRRFPPSSKMVLTARERAEIELLRARAAATPGR